MRGVRGLGRGVGGGCRSEKGSKRDIQSIEEWKDCMGEWTHYRADWLGHGKTQRGLVGRCWVVFSSERISRGRLCQGTSGLRDSAEPRQTAVNQEGNTATCLKWTHIVYLRAALLYTLSGFKYQFIEGYIYYLFNFCTYSEKNMSKDLHIQKVLQIWKAQTHQ